VPTYSRATQFQGQMASTKHYLVTEYISVKSLNLPSFLNLYQW